MKPKTSVMISLSQIVRRRRSARKLLSEYERTANLTVECMAARFDTSNSKFVYEETYLDKKLRLPVTRKVFTAHRFVLRGIPYPKRMVLYVGNKRVRSRPIGYMGDKAYFTTSLFGAE